MIYLYSEKSIKHGNNMSPPSIHMFLYCHAHTLSMYMCIFTHKYVSITKDKMLGI